MTMDRKTRFDSLTFSLCSFSHHRTLQRKKEHRRTLSFGKSIAKDDLNAPVGDKKPEKSPRRFSKNVDAAKKRPGWRGSIKK